MVNSTDFGDFGSIVNAAKASTRRDALDCCTAT
jgi:hypothetical protein